MSKLSHAPTFADLAESGRMALLRVFAPEVATEISELRASNVAERVIENLYGILSFSDIEENYLSLLKSAAAVEGGLALLAERLNSRNIDQTLQRVLRMDGPESLRKRLVAKPETAGRAWLTERWQGPYDSVEENLYDAEQMLLRYYWALAHPALLRPDERRGLLIYAGTLREGMPHFWRIELDGAGWPAPAWSAYGPLMNGRLREALKAPAGFPTARTERTGKAAA